MSLCVQVPFSSEWKECVSDETWYTLSWFTLVSTSSFFFLVCFLFPKKGSRLPQNRRRETFFVFRLLPIAGLVNFFLMPELETWKTTRKELDLWSTLPNVPFQALLGVWFAHDQDTLGNKTINTSGGSILKKILLLFAFGICVSLLGRRNTHLCEERGDVEGYLLWNGVWHYTLPLTTTLSLLRVLCA